MIETKSRTAIVFDRHPLWIDAISKLLARLDVEVLARTTDCNRTVGLVEEHCPDVLVAGIDPADPADVASLQAATEKRPAMKAVVVADNTERQAIETAFNAGVSVYCIKTAEEQDIAFAIRQTFERSIYIATDSSLALGPDTRDRAPAEEIDHGLTKREVEILRLVAEGHSNAQLARKLWVTEQTVKFHLSNIYRKLRVANRTEAGRWAQVNGLLPTEREELERVPAIA